MLTSNSGWAYKAGLSFLKEIYAPDGYIFESAEFQPLSGEITRLGNFSEVPIIGNILPVPMGSTQISVDGASVSYLQLPTVVSPTFFWRPSYLVLAPDYAAIRGVVSYVLSLRRVHDDLWNQPIFSGSGGNKTHSGKVFYQRYGTHYFGGRNPLTDVRTSIGDQIRTQFSDSDTGTDGYPGPITYNSHVTTPTIRKVWVWKSSVNEV